MTLGEKISKLRKEKNYTQEQLADVLGVSRQSISKWELNVAYPETDKLLEIGKKRALFHEIFSLYKI
jgi:transcriptional regulator with XRE-family HTH domain